MESEMRKATEEIKRLREEVSSMTKENVHLKVRQCFNVTILVYD